MIKVILFKIFLLISNINYQFFITVDNSKSITFFWFINTDRKFRVLLFGKILLIIEKNSVLLIIKKVIIK